MSVIKPIVKFGAIDPGLDGALAFMYYDGSVIARPTPLVKDGTSRDFNIPAMVQCLKDYCDLDLLVIERAVPMRKEGRVQGVSSTFSFGRGYGIWLGIIHTLGIKLHIMRSQDWKAHTLRGTKKDKVAAISYAQARHPEASLMATPRSRTPHDGMADAICMLHYAQYMATDDNTDVADKGHDKLWLSPVAKVGKAWCAST